MWRVLRQYVESDPHRFPAEVLEALSGNYPFTGVRPRLKVLSWLCDRFLQSREYKSIVRNEGRLTSDEHCRECGKPGDVLLCDGCEACYHLECAQLKDVPDGQWLCQVHGVTDCEATSCRSHKQPLRMTPLGYDRHGRRYWFAVRRIFVQDDKDGSVTYYSTLPQLYDLLARLDVYDLEHHLHIAIMELLPSIAEQMRVTMELTAQRVAATRTKIEPYLVTDNLDRLGDILSRQLGSDVERSTTYMDDSKADDGDKSLLLLKLEELIGLEGGRLTDTFWSNGLSTEKVLSRRDQQDIGRAVASLAEDGREAQPIEKILGYRLGELCEFRNYVNQYSVNDYAKTPYLRAKERDKKKYLCGRFSLADEGAFEWSVPKGRDMFGTASSVGVIIQQSMLKMSQRIPLTLMHRLWKADGLDRFRRAMTSPCMVEVLRDSLLRFECAMRKPLLTNVWWGTLGHTRLTRTTAEDREWKQKFDAKKKKQDRMLMVADADDEDSDIIWVKYTKLGGPPRHSLWRQKDEQYRVNGRGALGGWMWVSNTLRRQFVPCAQKPPLGITVTSSDSELTSLTARKAYKLECVVQKLVSWRIKQQSADERRLHASVLRTCYSPTCRQGFLPLPVAESGPDAPRQQCYSVLCRQALTASVARTDGVVHASDPLKSQMTKASKTVKENVVLGEGKPFPLPVPFDFRVRRTGQQSLLVLPQRALKRLARQGGLNSNYFAPGFHRIAKSNPHVWNYPCQRPLFDHCWRYLTLRAKSYHAVALSLRVLYACIRWADMERDEDDNIHVTVHYPDHDEVRTVIGHKEWPPDGFYEQYKLRVQLIPLDDSNSPSSQASEDTDIYRPGRASDGRSPRKRRATSRAKLAGLNGARRHGETKVTEKWIDGVDLKLWEIANYWREVELRGQRTDTLMPPPASVMVKYSTTKLAATEGTEFSPAISRSAPRRRVRLKQYEEYEYGDFEEEYVDVESCERPARKVVYERHVNPFKADSRIQRRSASDYENALYAKHKRHLGGVTGGGKFAHMQGEGQLRRLVLCPADPPQVARSADTPRVVSNASPIDEPPVIPRYDPAQYPGDASAARTPTAVTLPQRVVYASHSPASVQQSSTARSASRVLVIRRADGSTHLIRPVVQSTTRDSQGAVRTIITTTKAGGATMGEVRGATNGVDLSHHERTSSGFIQQQQQRQFINGSLTDHAGMAQPRRMIATLRGRAAFVGGQPTRFVQVAPPGSLGVHPQSSSSTVYIRGVRGQADTTGSSVVIAEKDPFMKRMAAEKAISGTPTICASGPSVSTRRSTGNTYAGYYGENSNDRIDVEEYQMLAEQGYRPPGRPPGRLTSSYGYGPRVHQQRSFVQSDIHGVNVVPVSQRGGRTGTPGGYRAAATTVIGTDFRPVVKYAVGFVIRMQETLRGGQPSSQGLSGQVRSVTTYKEYCMRRGIEPRDRYRHPGPVRFDFESNEEEERAIAEAIAHEEEIMRMEEESRVAARSSSDKNSDVRFKDEIRRKELAKRRESGSGRFSGYREGDGHQPSNLDIRKDDPLDLIICKQLLSVMVMQVCKWDRHYGWHKTILKRVCEERGGDGIHRTLNARRAYNNQSDVDLGERIDRYKKEVNKRRVKLEARAELEAGMVTPWRRPRGRPNKNGRRTYATPPPMPPLIGMPVDPSEISLGDNSIQWPQVKTEEQDNECESEKPLKSRFSVRSVEEEASTVKSAVQGGLVTQRETAPLPDEVPLERPALSSQQSGKGSSSLPPAVSASMSPATSREDRKKYKRKREASSSDDEKAGVQSNSSVKQRGRQRKKAKVETATGRAQDPSVDAAAAVVPESAPDSPHEIDPTAKHCICNKPYNPKKFYVGCDVCYRWFHGKCVGISERKSKKMSSWTCDECTKEQKKSEQELYCVCQTPYDDSRFYVGCDGCEGWFHPQCVGITQAEAEKAAQYLCPACVKSTQSGYESGTSTSSSATRTLSRADYPLLWRLLEALTEHRTSWPFREKVDPIKYPDYYKIIKKPMDLGLVQSKIERLEYDRLKDFSADVTQIFENARTYNAKDSAIYQCADILEQRFRERLIQVKEQIDGRNRERNQVSESRTVDSSLDIDTDQLLNTGETVDPSVFGEII
ncbi:Nucleosome-remodeling factor subunit [Toxocara canis]|uniref:Nucleosome-remodeling factor subunit n=1 Tax=Toxocara canis TaxID=6265 RepID=A0A0B2VYV0_TOXCA|nr:Nucleosome-remodeling factor subunit [Toxocara canis]